MDPRLTRAGSARVFGNPPDRRAGHNFRIGITLAASLCLQCLTARTGEAVEPAACLDVLGSTERSEVSGGLLLGRVFWDGEVIEPVLIRKNDEQDVARYSFRNCSSGLPTEIAIEEADLEIFNSALVAHFVRERTAALTMFDEVPFLGYTPQGEAALAFRGAGGMLEARRLDDTHVEVTGTGAVQIIPTEGSLERETVAILLVATRQTMRAMEPNVWEEAWGDRPEDPQIEREIIWWELAGPGKFKVHSAVASFEDLANRVAVPATEAETHWDGVVAKSLKPILDRAALSLLVVDAPEHIDLAEAMLELASTTHSDAALDVAVLEDRRSKQEHLRLEGAASRGRYWSLTRLFDLAAIMPDRIAGKVRRNYFQSALQKSAAGAVDSRFSKDYVTLETGSPAFQVANAVYQDQAAGMAKMMSFLRCLLEDASVRLGSPDRLEILEEGLARLDLSSERLAEMDVGKAFQYLFQGFILPADLRARERSFVSSISSGDPEVAELVRTLQSSFATATLDDHAACEVALIPDDILLGRPAADRPVMVVASMPTLESGLSTALVPEPPIQVAAAVPPPSPPTRSDPPSVEPVDVVPTELATTPSVDPAPITPQAPVVVAQVASQPTPADLLYDEARLAARKARLALANAIEAKGSRHTRRKIQKGNLKLDSGKQLLSDSNGADMTALREANLAFAEAEKIFVEAMETSWRKEHSKPKLRVH